jgi:hypothetical protein
VQGVLLMCAALAGAPRSWPRVPYRVVAAVARTASVLGIFLVVLDTALTNDSDYCTGNARGCDLGERGGTVPSDRAGRRIVGRVDSWVISRRRAGPAALYAVWLATVAVTVVLSLAVPLHAARPCGPSGIG